MMSVKNLVCCIAVFLLVVLSLAPQSHAVEDCPKHIHESVKVGHDWFCPRGGPILDEANIVLDCQNYTIKGSGAGVGVQIRGDHSGIDSCRIEGFKVGVVLLRVFQSGVWDSWIGNNEVGIFLDRATEASVVRSRLYDNKDVGIYGPESSVFFLENEFDRNGYDQQVGFLPTGKNPYPLVGRGQAMTGAAVYLPQAIPRQMPVGNPPLISLIENKVEESMLARVGVNPKLYAEVIKKVQMTKSVFIEPGKLSVMIVFRALEPVEDLVVFEIMDKNLTTSVFDVSSKWPFLIVEYDPVIRFNVGSMEKGREVQIVYSINGIEGTSDTLATIFPSSVVSLDRQVRSQTSRLSLFLFWIYVVLFGVWGFLNWRLKRKKMYLSIGALSVVVTVLFVSLQMRQWVVGSEWFHEILLCVLLFSGGFYLGVQSFLILVNAPGILRK